jgi:hypothetical protein
MATEVTEKIEHRTKQHAEDIINGLKELLEELVPRSWSIAEKIWEIHDKNLWQVVGYESRRDIRNALSISNGTWYNNVNCWDWAKDALKDDKITRAQMKRLQMGNVRQLLRLDLKRRFDPKWITKALTLTEAELEAQIDHVLNNESEPEEGLGKPEATVVLKFKCTTSQKEVILDLIRDFLRRQGMPEDAEAQALCLMLIDYKNEWPEAGPVIEQTAPKPAEAVV